MGLEDDLMGKLGIVIEAVREPQELTLSSGLRMIHSGGEVQYSLIGQAITLFDECVDDILRDDRFSGKVLRETVNNRLEHLVAMAIDEDWRERANIQSGVTQMINDLEEVIVPWTFVCPVENLELRGDVTFRVGKVEFFVFKSRAERYYQERCVTINMKNYTEEEKTRHRERFNDMYRARLDDKACTEVIVTSEEILAGEIGISMIETAINLLRAYAPLFISIGDRPRAKINFREGQTRLAETSLLYSQSIGFRIKGEVTGSLMPFVVNQSIIEHLKEKAYFDVVARCIFAPDTDLERRIARAVQWFGFGSHDTRAPDKVAKYMTGMEALFLDGEHAKGDNIAKRATFLLGSNADQNVRDQTYTSIRNLYDCRNAIIHEGCEKVDEENIDYMEQIAIRSLIAVATRTNDWQELSELIEWVNDQEQTHGKLNDLALNRRR